MNIIFGIGYDPVTKKLGIYVTHGNSVTNQLYKGERSNFILKMGFKPTELYPIEIPAALEAADKKVEKLTWLRDTILAKLQSIKSDHSNVEVVELNYDGDINIGFPSSSNFSPFLLDASIHQIFQNFKVIVRAFSSTKEIVQEAETLFKQQFEENYDEEISYPQLYVNVARERPPTFNPITRRTSLDSLLASAYQKKDSSTNRLTISLSLPNILEDEGDDAPKESLMEGDIPATPVESPDNNNAVNRLGDSLAKLSIFSPSLETSSSTMEEVKDEKDSLKASKR